MFHDPSSGALTTHVRMPGQRLVAASLLTLHPQARAAFQCYCAVRFALPIPATLLPPVLVIRDQGRFLIVGNFASRIAQGEADRMAVSVLPALTEEQVVRLTWQEIGHILCQQLAPAGTRDAIEALAHVPVALRRAWFGSRTDRQLARAFGRRLPAGIVAQGNLSPIPGENCA